MSAWVCLVAYLLIAPLLAVAIGRLLKEIGSEYPSVEED